MNELHGDEYINEYYLQESQEAKREYEESFYDEDKSEWGW